MIVLVPDLAQPKTEPISYASHILNAVEAEYAGSMGILQEQSKQQAELSGLRSEVKTLRTDLHKLNASLEKHKATADKERYVLAKAVKAAQKENGHNTLIFTIVVVVAMLFFKFY